MIGSTDLLHGDGQASSPIGELFLEPDTLGAFEFPVGSGDPQLIGPLRHEFLLHSESLHRRVLAAGTVVEAQALQLHKYYNTVNLRFGNRCVAVVPLGLPTGPYEHFAYTICGEISKTHPRNYVAEEVGA
jgi:hypothetical protein